MKTQSQRATFSSDLEPFRALFLECLPLLELKSEWYGSIYFERKTSKSYSVNLKQSQVNDQINMGVVFRIYDGYTLFEEATDELELEHLRSFAQSFGKKVLSQPRAQTPSQPYLPPSWKEKLSHPLEEEITSQLPPNLTAKTPVHFGIRFEKNPYDVSTAQYLERLKAILSQFQNLAPREGLSTQDLTYLMVRENFYTEESIFVDRETNMSQTLFRFALTLIAMSGADRTFTRLGGLGGLETTQITDSEILELLRDLKGLKTADRLSPGRYRVLFGPSLTGVLAHEAFGHSQEGDTCARGRSKAWELHQSGEVVGNAHATILNNPAIYENANHSYGAWGSYFFDEEGWLAQEQVLLDQGKLQAPMTNLTSAIRLNIPRTANGKRENWAHGVYTRQTNTYFSPGNKTLDELMTELGEGFLALHAAGGMEDPKGMGIQVGIAYLHEVKRGQLTGRIFKGPAGGDIQMTGYTPEVLNAIQSKSKIEYLTSSPDRARFPYNDVGGCGKYHKELVFAGCGGPYMLLDPVILG